MWLQPGPGCSLRTGCWVSARASPGQRP
jgi:hypothetical protein